MAGSINFANVSTGFGHGLVGTVGNSDAWRIVGYANAVDAGSLEIATADNGNEPIYVRQYNYNSPSSFGTFVRSATLLDASGNTLFPGTVTGSAIIRSGGTSSQFLKADGSVDANNYLTANQSISLTGAVTGSGTTSIVTSFANTHLAGINQDLTTASGPTFAAIAASNSYYGVVGAQSADAQKWYLVATVDITSQYGSASAVIRFNSVGGNGASGLGGLWAGSCFIRAKQQSAMSSGLDNFTIGWNYCHGFNPSSAVIGVKTTDNASHKIVNIYLLCPISYEGMSWQIDNLAGSITASGVGTNYVTTLPTGLATYTGASAIWSDWTNITVPGASTFTGLITANGGITGNLTGHASLDIPLTGSSAITGSLISSNASNLGSVSLPWGSVYGTTLYEGGVALSSKYLGISASIPLTQISDWGTYINQPVLTTSQPTFSGGVRSAGTYDILSTVNGNSGILTARLSQGSLLLRNTTGAFAQFSVNADLYSPTVYLTSSISGYYPNFNVSGNITASTLSVGNTSTFTGLITANGGITSPQYSLPNLNAAPASSTSTGTYGEIRWCDGYIYLCTATNTWKRAALTTW